MTEKLPVADAEKEKEPISDKECVEAMRAGKFEFVQEWYAQQEVRADQDPTPNGRVGLTVRLAVLQFESGIIDEDTGESYAFATLEAAREDAYQQYNEEGVRLIDDALARMRAQSV